MTMNLKFFGAPWPEYQYCASRTGLDVAAYDSLFISHSLPIPKGLAPLVPAHLDVHLISLIVREKTKTLFIIIKESVK